MGPILRTYRCTNELMSRQIWRRPGGCVGQQQRPVQGRFVHRNENDARATTTEGHHGEHEVAAEVRDWNQGKYGSQFIVSTVHGRLLLCFRGVEPSFCSGFTQPTSSSCYSPYAASCCLVRESNSSSVRTVFLNFPSVSCTPSSLGGR